ncbi:MAG: hypothetical protein JW834_04740 [Candidatus Diapherotrites archaeon]|nr:hypothetical protein [Candidatus Diapherotrites archaeon]
MRDRSRNEGVLAVVAALVVLFTAVLDPMVSVALSASLLALWGAHKLLRR